MTASQLSVLTHVFPQRRDLDPTTTLVQHVSPQASSKPSVLVVSSHSIHQLRADTLDNEPLLGFSLAGLPTAVAHLKGALWALADSMAGLSLLDLDHPCSLRRLTANLPLIAAHVMCRVPDSDTHRGMPRWDACWLELLLPHAHTVILNLFLTRLTFCCLR